MEILLPGGATWQDGLTVSNRSACDLLGFTNAYPGRAARETAYSPASTMPARYLSVFPGRRHNGELLRLLRHCRFSHRTPVLLLAPMHLDDEGNDATAHQVQGTQYGDDGDKYDCGIDDFLFHCVTPSWLSFRAIF